MFCLINEIRQNLVYILHNTEFMIPIGAGEYPEYTGTGLTVMLHADTATVRRLAVNKDTVYAYVKRAFKQRFQVK